MLGVVVLGCDPPVPSRSIYRVVDCPTTEAAVGATNAATGFQPMHFSKLE